MANYMIPINQYPIPLVDECLFIDNSAQEKTQTCLRSAGYYLGHRREGKKSTIAKDFGKAIHKVLEDRYRNHPAYLGPEVIDSMVRTADKAFAPEVYNTDPEDFRNYGTGISLIKKYASEYTIEEGDTYRFPTGLPFVEQAFAIPLGTILVNHDAWVREMDINNNTISITKRFVGNVTIVQKGKIDRVYQRDDRIYGQDHKTTSIMGPQFFAEFELSSQVHSYSWAIEQLIGILPSGFQINGLGVRKPTPSGKALEFKRSIIPIYRPLVDEWKTDTLQLVATFIRGCIAGELPKETKWCVGKYGPCEYKPVCGLEPQMRQMALYSNEYRDVTWDPLKD